MFVIVVTPCSGCCYRVVVVVVAVFATVVARQAQTGRARFIHSIHWHVLHYTRQP